MLMLLALALQTATPTPAVSSPAKPVVEKPKCRRLDTTGSIMGERTCHTAAEWKAIDAANAANADRYRNDRAH